MTSADERFTELWPTLTHCQKRFVSAMLRHKNKTEAAHAIGINRNTTYGWPDTVDEAIQLLTEKAVERSLDILVSEAVNAALVKVAGLESDDEKIRQAVATEILDRTHGKATQRTELHAELEGPLSFEPMAIDYRSRPDE